jgi:hypothetical protein
MFHWLYDIVCDTIYDYCAMMCVKYVQLDRLECGQMWPGLLAVSENTTTKDFGIQTTQLGTTQTSNQKINQSHTVMK